MSTAVYLGTTLISSPSGPSSAVGQVADLLDLGWYANVTNGSGDSSVYGSGAHSLYTSTGKLQDMLLLQTGTTANSAYDRMARVWPENNQLPSTFDMSISRLAEFRFYFDNPANPFTANTVCRIGFFSGQLSTTASGFQPLSKGFGIEIRNKRIWLVSHDGTNASSLDTQMDITGAGQQIHTIRLMRDSTGLYALLDGVVSSKLTLFLPTDTVASVSPGVFHVAGTNGATAADARLYMHRQVKHLSGF